MIMEDEVMEIRTITRHAAVILAIFAIIFFLGGIL